jgi:hypothetical protein
LVVGFAGVVYTESPAAVNWAAAMEAHDAQTMSALIIVFMEFSLQMIIVKQ